jgi:hypothetical protein
MIYMRIFVFLGNVNEFTETTKIIVLCGGHYKQAMVYLQSSRRHTFDPSNYYIGASASLKSTLSRPRWE